MSFSEFPPCISFILFPFLCLQNNGISQFTMLVGAEGLLERVSLGRRKGHDHASRGIVKCELLLLGAALL